MSLTEQGELPLPFGSSDPLSNDVRFCAIYNQFHSVIEDYLEKNVFILKTILTVKLGNFQTACRW